jgi:hemoglobin
MTHAPTIRNAAPGIAADVTEDLIRTVVEGFYARIRRDSLLGPIFEAAIQPAQWPAHLDRMVTFWGAVLLMTGRYHGQPVPKHMPLPIDRGHFQHWLNLFADTVEALCPPDAAALFIDRAERIANSLMLARERMTIPEAGTRPVLEPLLKAERVAS